MAKTLKLKCLTDEHLEKHRLEPEYKGKIGVFDGEELIGVASPPDGWEPKDGDGDGNGQEGKKLAELFASEIGLPGKSLVDIAAMVKRGTEAPQDQFAALSEAIHEGGINMVEAGKLADAGRVRFSTILRAQEAERKVEAAVKAGKVLPEEPGTCSTRRAFGCGRLRRAGRASPARGGSARSRSCGWRRAAHRAAGADGGSECLRQREQVLGERGALGSHQASARTVAGLLGGDRHGGRGSAGRGISHCVDLNDLRLASFQSPITDHQ